MAACCGETCEAVGGAAALGAGGGDCEGGDCDGGGGGGAGVAAAAATGGFDSVAFGASSDFGTALTGAAPPSEIKKKIYLQVKIIWT